MSFDILLDSLTNDFIIEDRDLKLTQTTGQVTAQSLKKRLNTEAGSWFLNSSYGIPYLSSILAKYRVSDKKRIDSIFVSEILKEDGVQKVISYDSTIDSRTGVYSAEALIRVSDEDIFIAINNKPLQTYEYPIPVDNDPKIDCGQSDLSTISNTIYEFVNINGLPNTSSWSRTWGL